MKRVHVTMVLCVVAVAATGCERYLDGLYAPIPPYVEPDRPDMGEEDMPIVIVRPDDGPDAPDPVPPASVMATGGAEAVTVSWSPVDGAVGYEVQIDGAMAWRFVEGTELVDEDAEPGAIASAATSASQATARPHVALEAMVETREGAARRYKVRAVFPENVRSEPSEEVMAGRAAGTLEYAWERSEDAMSWEDIADASSRTYEDETAPGNGDSVGYRCRVRFVGEMDWTECEKAEGWRLAVKDIVAGFLNTCVLFNNNTFKCWGGSIIDINEPDGENPFIQDTPPTEAFPLANNERLTALLPLVATEDYENQNLQLEKEHLKLCALSENKALHCWSIGREFNPETTRNNTKKIERHPNIQDNIAQFVVGLGHICIRYDLGPTQCWGANTNGQLGLGDFMNRPEPTMERLQKEPIQISTGNTHTCAVEFGGDVLCWGNNFESQLGVGDERTDYPTPQRTLSNIAREVHALVEGTCIVTKSGTVRCWGPNHNGQLGYGDTNHRPNSSMAMDVSLDGTCRQFTTSTYRSTNCVVLQDDRVQCWGLNEHGEAGLGPAGIATAPNTPIDLGQPVQKVSVGGGHTCALLADGSIRCWGSNTIGQLGYGDKRDRGLLESDFPLPEVDVW